MPVAPPSENEEKRLVAVHQLKLMGTPAEERFDKITRLVQQLFNVPFSAITLAGEKLNWIKSAQGFNGIEALRKNSYCHYTVLKEGVCLIKDARKDSRVHDTDAANTWVFYAGIPLHFKGERVGALCIGDNKPRELNPDQVKSLSDLSILAERELEITALSESQLALAQSNEELEKKANIDTLTHIWNRGAIFNIIQTELTRPTHPSFIALLMIDIDNYKHINDAYGHAAGDLVLQQIAERLRKAVRPNDAVGRYGGDEFLAVLIHVPESEIMEIANRICNNVSKDPILFEEKTIQVTCSVGVAIYQTSDDVHSLLRRADEALYFSKSKGKNQAAL